MFTLGSVFVRERAPVSSSSVNFLNFNGVASGFKCYRKTLHIVGKAEQMNLSSSVVMRKRSIATFGMMLNYTQARKSSN